jgi:hypothetical protein
METTNFCSRCSCRLDPRATTCPCAQALVPVTTGALPPLTAEADTSEADRAGELSHRSGVRKAVVGCTLSILVVLLGLWIAASSETGSSHASSTSNGYSSGANPGGVDYRGNANDFETGRTGSTSTTSTTTSNQTTVGDVTLTSGDAANQLAAIVAADRPGLRSQALGYWVPQLSSKKPGLVADGITYDYPAILADHTRLRSAYPGARLVWSADWTSFKNPDFWVTVAADERFATAQAANAWCDQQGFDKESCFAKRLTTTGGYDGNTKPR